MSKNYLVALLTLLLFVSTQNSMAQEEVEVVIAEFGFQEEMVISASKKKEKVKEAPATIMVITAKEIKERGYEDLEDALRDLPGIDFVHIHGTFPTIWTLRGLYGDENKRTLLLIDGIVENNILEGNVLGGPQYSIHNVERIEIIWGPASALYGANAFSGIINIITKKGSSVNGVEYQKGFGSYNTSFDKFVVGGKEKGVDFLLSGSLYNTDGPVFKERHPNYTHSYVRNAYSVVGRMSYKGLTFGFSRFDRPMGDGLFSNSPTVEAYGLPPYGYKNSEGTNGGIAQTDINGEKPSNWHSYTQTAFLKFDYNIMGNLILTEKLFYRETGIADDSYEYDFRDNSFKRDVYTHYSNIYGGELQADYSISYNHDIITGIQYEESNVERGYRGTVAMDTTRSRLLDKSKRVWDIYQNYAIYSQYRVRFPIFEFTSFIAGIRYDNNNVYGSTVNPRVGIVTKPHKKLTVKTLAGTAYRAPNSFELFTETSVRVKNPNLKPEKEVSTELNIGVNITKNILIESSVFRNDFDDIIVSNVQIPDVATDSDTLPNTQNQNRGTAKVKGFEIKSAVKVLDNLTCFANVSYQKATQNDGMTTFDVPNIANVKSNFGINYGVADLFTVSLIENLVGKRSVALTNPMYKDGKKVDGYFITNLSITTKKILDDRMSASVVVKNLLNEKYYDPGMRSANGGYYATRHPQPGRSAYLKLTLNLEKSRI